MHQHSPCWTASAAKSRKVRALSSRVVYAIAARLLAFWTTDEDVVQEDHQAAAFAFFSGGFLTVSANISSGFSRRSFSPGIGTGYSPTRQPRQTSSRECLSAAMSPFRDKYPSESAVMNSATSGTVF